jgi:hypothetical protein
MDAKTKKTWLSIALAIVIICAILAVAVIGTAVYVFRQHINAQFVSAQAAQNEFDRARERFNGQQPLIDLSGAHGEPVIHRREGHDTEIRALRALAFDPRAGKLVRVSLPFWLLRMAPSHNFSFRSAGDFDFDSDRMHLTVEDLERAGPGLLLDARNPRDGVLVLVWTE